MDVEGAEAGDVGDQDRLELAAFSAPPVRSSCRRGKGRELRATCLLIACIALPSLVFVSWAYRPTLAGFIAGAYRSVSPLQRQRPAPQERTSRSARSGAPGEDKYLGGLLAAGSDEQSCLSRYQSAMYRKPSPHKPSRHLLRRLRKYEENHRRCAPHTALYNRTLQLLVNAGSSAPEKKEAADCNYVIWSPCQGLGNRMLTLVSTFLYALLTDRVLLIDPSKDMASLFCEPFPAGASWLIPPDFPVADFAAFDRKHPQSYGNLLKRKEIDTDEEYAGRGGGTGRAPPSFLYVHLVDDYTVEDMHFYCEPDQEILEKVPWLLLKSDLYFVPGFFLNQEFEPELRRLFPEKDTVFHHLGRYLFHPTNRVWRMITGYYKAYLAPAEDRLGIQIRIFNSEDSPFEAVLNQVMNCTIKEKLLPETRDATASGGSTTPADVPGKTRAVLVTSLRSGFAEKIKDIYWEHPAAGDAVVGVFQPSHEEWQQTEKASHDARALAEIYLLSLTDVLVTSSWSTFGYIAQGLRGIKPWILVRMGGGTVPEPACVRDMSMEPCLHKPPLYRCREKAAGDNSRVVPFVTSCVDVGSGLKLIDRKCY